MSSEDLQAVYIEKLNALLPTVDFAKLDRSCNSKNAEYAKEILKKLHDLFVEVYTTDNLDSGYEFVDMPAVIQGQNTKHIGLGIVTLDLQSSGEHYGTFFLSPGGIIDDGSEEMKAADKKYLNTVYVPYDYWYTVYIERDHHVDFDHVPAKVADMLNACYPDHQEPTQRNQFSDQEMR